MTYSINSRKFQNDQFQIVAVENNDSRPNLKAHLEAQGFDGNIYHMERVTADSKKAAATVLCFKGATSGTFQPMV